MMAGFWVRTAMGDPVHINGSRKMKRETVLALLAALDAYATQVSYPTSLDLGSSQVALAQPPDNEKENAHKEN